MTASNGDGCVAVVTPNGVVTDYIYSMDDPRPGRIVAGADGNLWFAVALEGPESGSNVLRSSTTSGTITSKTLSAYGEPTGITTGSDGTLWFTDPSSPNIGQMTTAGAVKEFAIPSGAQNIVAGSDGNLWFTAGNQIGRITTAGNVAQFPLPTTTANAWDVTKGPDGNVWFTEQGSNNIGRITPAGVVTEFAVPSSPFGIATGPDGNLWFTEPAAATIARFLTP